MFYDNKHIYRKYGKVTQIVTSNRLECKAIFALMTDTHYSKSKKHAKTGTVY